MRPETEAFLESVREAEDPTRADEERVLVALRATVAAGAVLGTAAASSKLARLWAWSAGGGFKSGAVALVLVAAAAGGIAAVRGAVSPSPTPFQARGGAVTKLAPVPTPAPITKPAPIPPLAPVATPALAPKAGPAPRPASVPTSAPAAEPAPLAKPAPEPLVSSLRDELAALARAQAALRRGDGAAALIALDAPSPRPPQLAAERATLRILALCAVGRSAEARRAATALERLEPGSLQRDVISRSCAGGAPSSQR